MTSLRTLRNATARVVIPSAAAAAAFLVLAGPAAAASVTPTVVDGNPTCETYGLSEYKIDADPAAGNYGGTGFTVTIAKPTPETLDFSAASAPVHLVLMKGGPNANVYDYRPNAVTADTALTTPTNPNNSKPYGISHVSFCYGPTTPPQNNPTPQTPTPAAETPTPAAPAPAAEVAATVTPAPAAAQVLGVQIERAAPQVLGTQLAATGVDTTAMAVAGITLVGIGTALLPVTRRRRTSDAG